MIELRLTDADLQALVAPALQRHLRKRGFKMGTCSGDEPSAFYFPVNINLAGTISVTRDEDGCYTFQQEESPHVADRTAASLRMHAEAIAIRKAARR